MTRKDEMGDFDPHPGDPWHPSWEPGDGVPPPEADDADAFGGESASSVDEIYAQLERLSPDREEEGEEETPVAAPEPVTADVVPLSAGPGTAGQASTINWDTRNLAEDAERDEAVAPAVQERFSAEERVLREAAASAEASELDDELETVSRSLFAAEMAFFVYQLRLAAADLAMEESGNQQATAAAEDLRMGDGIAAAVHVEAEAAAGAIIALYAGFEEYRETAEASIEDGRRVTQIEFTRAAEVATAIGVLEAGLADAEGRVTSGAMVAELMRAAGQQTNAAADDFRTGIEDYALIVGVDESFNEAADRDAETSRSGIQLERARSLEAGLAMAAFAEELRSYAVVGAEAEEALELARREEATATESASVFAGVMGEAAVALAGAEAAAAASAGEVEAGRSAAQIELAGSQEFADAMVRFEATLQLRLGTAEAESLEHELRQADRGVDIERSRLVRNSTEAFAAGLNAAEAIRIDVDLTGELERSERNIEAAEMDEFAIHLEAIEEHLTDEDVARDGAASVSESERAVVQVEAAAIIEAEEVVHAAARRLEDEVARLELQTEIDESIALDRQLALVAAVAGAESVAAERLAPGPEQMAVAAAGGAGAMTVAGATTAAGVATVGFWARVRRIFGDRPGEAEVRAAPTVPESSTVRVLASVSGEENAETPEDTLFSEDPMDDAGPEADQGFDDDGDFEETSGAEDSGDEVPADTEGPTDTDDEGEQPPVSEGEGEPESAGGEFVVEAVPTPPMTFAEAWAAADYEEDEPDYDQVEAPDDEIAVDEAAEDEPSEDEASDDDGYEEAYVEEALAEGAPPEEAAEARTEDEASIEDEVGSDDEQETGEGEEGGEADLDDFGLPDFEDFTQEDYLKATTEEYAGLAASVAAASTEETEQMAVAAGIPGLESGVVGLEDVLESETAEGEPAPAPRSGSDLAVRVGTAAGLILLFVGALLFPVTTGVLIFLVLMIAAGEFYTSLIRADYRPLALFGLLGVAGALLGTWIWGTVAVPAAVGTAIFATALFFGVAPARRHALEDTSLTMMVTAWIGGFGAFAFVLVDSDNYRWLITAFVVITALMDIAQYFVGRRFGRVKLAPLVSPGKTVEGLAGGVAIALIAGVVLGFLEPFDTASGLALGVAIAIAAPLGDLAVSVVKRALGIKDMGSVLPGHGGILDRIDAMIFVVPAAWVVYSFAGLIT